MTTRPTGQLSLKRLCPLATRPSCNGAVSIWDPYVRLRFKQLYHVSELVKNVRPMSKLVYYSTVLPCSRSKNETSFLRISSNSQTLRLSVFPISLLLNITVYDALYKTPMLSQNFSCYTKFSFHRHRFRTCLCTIRIRYYRCRKLLAAWQPI